MKAEKATIIELKDVRLKGSLHYGFRTVRGKAERVLIGYTEPCKLPTMHLALERAYKAYKGL